MNRVEEVERMRRLMGTDPSAHPPRVTEFWRGVEGISVHMIPGSHPRNPYRSIFEMTVMTWGSTRTGLPAPEEMLPGALGEVQLDALLSRPGGLGPTWKWDRTPPRWRAKVVEAVLSGKTLPNALEGVTFSFVVERVSRWAFDQIARARLGVVFSSMGTRDNCHEDLGFRFHESTWGSPERLEAAKRACLTAKESYNAIVSAGGGSWQEGREVLPISGLHRFAMAANFPGLRGICAQRMKACEAEDVVAISSLLRREVEGVFPYLASFLRPGCDYGKRCDYHDSYSLSEAFSALFRGCGRWPAPEYTLGPDFQHNESCSSYETIAKQCGYALPPPTEPVGERKATSHPLDRALFYDGWAGAPDEDFPPTE